MKKQETVYTFARADALELPLAVADTLEEMAKITGLKITGLYMALERKSLISGRYRIRKVNIKDYDFSWQDYKLFCETEDLKPSAFKSLVRFREYLGDVYGTKIEK